MRSIVPGASSIFVTTLVTGGLLLLDQRIARSLVPIAYLIPVFFAATRWGFWPAALSSVLGIAAADFFFFAPLYSFRVEDPQEAVDLLLFLVVALVSSNLGSRLRKETDTLRRREKDLHELYDFSRRLAACFTISDLVSAVQEHFERMFGGPTCVFVVSPDGRLEHADPNFTLSDIQKSAMALLGSRGPLSRMIVDHSSGQRWLLHVVCCSDSVRGVVAINFGSDSQLEIDKKANRFEELSGEIGLTLKRLDIGTAMANAQRHWQTLMLRDAFHGTLSHELRSPLAAIRGSVSVLENIPTIQRDHRARCLVEAISEETSRLDGFTGNLLSATRITGGGFLPRFDWTDPEDIVNGAVDRRARRLSDHRIECRFAESLPLLRIDPVLAEEACGQILENAAKYSPSGSVISIDVREVSGWVIIVVSDQGVGLNEEERSKMGIRTFRGGRHDTVSGSGLGFWIAMTFVEANRGTLTVESRGAGLGTSVSISFPQAETSCASRQGARDE